MRDQRSRHAYQESAAIERSPPGQQLQELLLVDVPQDQPDAQAEDDQLGRQHTVACIFAGGTSKAK